MTDHRGRGVYRLAILALSSLFLFTAISVLADDSSAEETPPRPRIVDKKLGEEEEIRLRNEWFYSTRRAGTSSSAEILSLRIQAIEETRRAVALQREQQGEAFAEGQNVWVEKGPSPSAFGGWTFGTVSGRTQAIEADWAGGVLYVGGAAGGVWKSTNDGLSWESIFDSVGALAVGAIAVDPNDSNVLWVGTGDNIVGCESYFGIGMFRSGDGGQNWELRNGEGISTLSDLSSFASIKIDPRDSNKIVTGGRFRGCSSGAQQDGGIYTTTNGGGNWILRLSNTQIHEIVRDPQVLDILWAGTDRGVYKSVDNGVNWIQQTASGLPSGNLGRTEIAIAPSAPNTVYVLYDNPSDEFWRTTDGGATWTMMDQDACDGQCSYNMVIRVDPLNPDVVYRGTVRIFKTSNGGTSWTTLTNSWGASQQVHQDTHSMLMNPNLPGTFYVGSDGGLWKSEDAGASFLNRNGNLNFTQFYAVGVDSENPERICGGAQDNSSLARNGSNIWELQAVTGDGFVCAIDPQNNYAYITSYPSGGYPNVWRSNNGLFGNFNDVTGGGSGISQGDRIAWVTPYIVDPRDPNILFLGTHRVYRSENFGTSWTQVGPADASGSGNATLSVIEINRSFTSVVYSGSYAGAVWRSADGGDNWTELTNGLPSRAVNDIAGDPTNPDRAFAVLGGFNTAHLWEWNAGQGWIDRGSGLPNAPANTVLMLTDQDILVGVDTGVYRSTDGGQTFLPFMAGLPLGMVVTDLKFNEVQNIVTAGTYGRGAWQVDSGPIQPILLHDAVEQPLLEIDGDGDGKIEPGETWGIRPKIRNAGGLEAFGVTARLSTTTPGVTVLPSDTGSYGDIGPNLTVPVITPYQFTVDPSFDCGDTLVFDLLDIASDGATYADQSAIFAAFVQGGTADPVVTILADENFDPPPQFGWPHYSGDPELPGCALAVYVDEWKIYQKDEEHGISFHNGVGPGGAYWTGDFSWLHPYGYDVENAPGLEIPDDAIAATLTIEHWYETAEGQDGGQVLVDAVYDGQDLYAPIKPVGDYPGAALDTGFCNGLEGQKAFHGSSGGWITSQFDLTPYKGQRIFLAFVFGSDFRNESGEGWYIDRVTVEYQEIGPPVCDVARWPGTVSSASFSLTGPGTIEANWGDACNTGEFPEQAYSIQSGDLDGLRASGTYSHAPIGDLCDQTSTTSFSPGAGNQYYLIVPEGEGREGGAGSDSSGIDRPQSSSVCGERRVSCP